MSGTGVTVGALMTDLGNALIKLRRFKDDQGRPMYLGRAGGLVILAPPDLEQQFRQILNNGTIVTTVAASTFGPQDNYLKGMADLVIDPYLTDTNDWYLFDLGSIGTKPLVYLDRKSPETTQLTDPQSAQVFNTRTFSWGVDFRGAIGYGFWQTGVQVTQ
jgi:phage major head subunit gpT-like protein